MDRDDIRDAAARAAERGNPVYAAGLLAGLRRLAVPRAYALAHEAAAERSLAAHPFTWAKAPTTPAVWWVLAKRQAHAALAAPPSAVSGRCFAYALERMRVALEVRTIGGKCVRRYALDKRAAAATGGAE